MEDIIKKYITTTIKWSGIAIVVFLPINFMQLEKYASTLMLYGVTLAYAIDVYLNVYKDSKEE